MKLILLPLFSLCLVGQGFSQTTPAPIPPAPIAPDFSIGTPVQSRAPAFARWSISSEIAPADSPSATPALKKNGRPKVIVPRDKQGRFAYNIQIIITKTNDVIEVERHDEHREIWHLWMAGGFLMAVAPEEKSIDFVARPRNPGDDNPLYVDFSETDFPEFRWVAADKYTGVETVNGRPCLIFKGMTEVSQKPEAAAISSIEPGQSIPVEAAVEYYSRLPVRLIRAGKIWSYTFDQPPEKMQVVPEKVQAVMDAAKKQTKDFGRLPEKPF